ncbi:MAG: hypothetical protein IPG44_06690 [Anaerolineales bacterium]|nr:hypothetical protein [Anaerolineales bacterium]
MNIVKTASTNTATGAAQIKSQILRKPENSENAQYKIAATPPKKSEKMPKKKNANGKNFRPLLRRLNEKRLG